MSKAARQLGALLLAAAGAARAADGAPPAQLDAALRLAVANRPELAIEREKIAAANGKVRETRGAFLPTVALSSTVQDVKRFDTFSGITAAATFAGKPVSVDIASDAPRYQGKVGLEVVYNLYKGGADQARLDEARLTVRAAQAQYTVETQKVLREAADAYVAWMKAGLAYGQAQQALALAEQEAAVQGQRLRSGKASAIEQQEADIQRQSRQLDLRSAARGWREAQRKYCSALHSDCATADVAGAPPSVPAMPDLAQLSAQFGLSPGAELDKAEADAAAARLRIKQARAEAGPVIDLFANHLSNGHSNAGFIEAREGFKRAESAIGLRLNWNLFDGHRSDSHVLQEAAAAEQLRLKQVLAARDLAASRDSVQDDLAALEAQLALENMQLTLAQSKQAIGAERLRLKLISDLDYGRLGFAVAAARYRIDSLTLDLIASRFKNALL